MANKLLTRGKFANVAWDEVEDYYLKWIIDNDYKPKEYVTFAQEELDRRAGGGQTVTSPAKQNSQVKDPPAKKSTAPAVIPPQNWNSMPVMDKPQTLKDFLLGMKDDLASLIQGRFHPEAMITALINSAHKTEKIWECTLPSILRSIMYLSQAGLIPDNHDKHAYLIPYRIKGVMTCTVIIGYQGYIELFHRSGFVASVRPLCVYENDEFYREEGANPILKHIPTDGDRGKMTGAYCCVKLVNGETQWEYIPMVKLKKIREDSQNKDGAIWNKWPDEMHMKAAIRRIENFIPTSPEMSIAVALDNAGTSGEPMDLTGTLPNALIGLLEEPKVTQTDKVAEKLAKTGKKKASGKKKEAKKEEEPPPDSPNGRTKEEVKNELFSLLNDHDKVLPQEFLDEHQIPLIHDWTQEVMQESIDNIYRILGEKADGE